MRRRSASAAATSIAVVALRIAAPPIRCAPTRLAVPRAGERRRAQGRLALLRRARSAAGRAAAAPPRRCRTRRRSIRSASRSARSFQARDRARPAATTPIPARTQRRRRRRWYSVVAPELKFNSNWARHEFTGDLRGSYSPTTSCRRRTGRPSTASSPAASTSRATPASISKPNSWSAPTIPAARTSRPGSRELPIFTTLGGTAGLGHRFNRFDISAKGGAERTVYQDSHLHRRHHREQRGPQLQPLLHAAARQLRADARRQAVRRGRRRPPRARSRRRLLRLPAQFRRRLRQGRLDLRVHAAPDRRGRGRLARAPLRGSDSAEDRRADGRRLAHLGGERAHHRQAHRRHARRRIDGRPACRACSPARSRCRSITRSAAG